MDIHANSILPHSGSFLVMT